MLLPHLTHPKLTLSKDTMKPISCCGYYIRKFLGEQLIGERKEKEIGLPVTTVQLISSLGLELLCILPIRGAHHLNSKSRLAALADP